MSDDQAKALQNQYETLRAQAGRKLKEGFLWESLTFLEAALDLARKAEDQDLVDLALCNRNRVAAELDAREVQCSALGRLLLRCRDSGVRFRAAFTLNRAYVRLADAEKALFYGNLALEAAQSLDSRSFQADALNGIGLAHVASSRFENAVEAFEKALDHLRPSSDFRRAVLLDNVGYCYVIQGRMEDGFRALFESVRSLRRLREPWFEKITLVSLCFAYLEIGRYDAALRHGLRALRSAETLGDRSVEKSALFLLGEAAKHSGQGFQARRFFSRLQESYFPDAGYLPEMLMTIDARSMVNLKA